MQPDAYEGVFLFFVYVTALCIVLVFGGWLAEVVSAWWQRRARRKV